MGKTYYHISKIENKESILSNGLKSNSGYIFLLDSEEQIPNVAMFQIGQYEFSVFSVDSDGITARIMCDNVAEIGAGSQYRIKQKTIEPKYVNHLRDEKHNYWDLAEATNRKKIAILDCGEDVEEELVYMVRRSVRWTEHWNKKYGTDLKPNPNAQP